MKKVIVFLTVLVMFLSCVPMTAMAAESDLPFQLEPPANFTVRWLETNDSPTTVKAVYSLSNEMTAFFKEKEEATVDGKIEEFMAKYPYDDIGITTQVDWAVDDVEDAVSGWHYNEFWNYTEGFGLGYDNEGRIRVGEWDGVDMWVGNATETVNDHWVTRYVSADALNGNPEQKTPGLKDQLKPDQYTFDEEEGLKIDYSKHTVYYRMRFVVWTSKDTDDGVVNDYYYSPWSATASVGKDAGEAFKLSKDSIKAPEITGLRMTDKTFNDNPVVAFTLTVPEELVTAASEIIADSGTIFIETEARVQGDTEWTLMGNTDRDIKAGEMECALLTLVNDERPSIPADTVIELRCRYYCEPAGEDAFYSDYSKIISFGTDDIGIGDTTTIGVIAPETDKPVCSLCHFCPQPLGLCIFIWLAIIIVIVVIVIVVIKKSKGKDKKTD